MGLFFLFAYGGNWLDENYPNPKVYYNKILVMVGRFGLIQCDSASE
jgi:hypothetical protein